MTKTKKQYYCKYCNSKIAAYTALYGKATCHKCQNRKFFIDKDELINLYHIQKKSIIDISKIFNCCYGTIYKWLLNYNIKIKTKKETHLGKKRPEHSKLMKGDGNPIFGTQRPESVREKISKSRMGKYTGRNSGMFGKKPSHKCSYGKGGKYNNVWMKSSYELKYAKYLDQHNIKWLYEPKAFDLGETTYRPDFYLPELDSWIEVKGYWTEEATNKFNLFKKLYSNIKIYIIDKSALLRRKIDVK